MNKTELAVKILELVGGFDNVSELSNCKTRLRFELNELALANQEELKLVYGVMGVVEFGSQLQVVLGPETEEVALILLDQLKLPNGNK